MLENHLSINTVVEMMDKRRIAKMKVWTKRKMGPWTEPCVVLTFQKKKKKNWGRLAEREREWESREINKKRESIFHRMYWGNGKNCENLTVSTLLASKQVSLPLFSGRWQKIQDPWVRNERLYYSHQKQWLDCLSGHVGLSFQFLQGDASGLRWMSAHTVGCITGQGHKPGRTYLYCSL